MSGVREKFGTPKQISPHNVAGAARLSSPTDEPEASRLSHVVGLKNSRNKAARSKGL